jgi:hypothetical protein
VSVRKVEVEWLDSIGQGRWRDRDEVLRAAEDEPLLHHSCGYLIAENDRYVLLALNLHGSGDIVGDTIQIPRVAVLSVEELK